jgi:cytochrome c-type biogenesis protein CcmH
MAAARRGETDRAATLWERLLTLNPPDEVRGILEQNIAAWRGEPPPAAPVSAMPASADVPDDAVVSARVSLSEAAIAAITADANVFIIARDPAAPSPPIAVARRKVSELPAVVSLTDAQSMVEGRNLSAFAEVEVLARVSLSGGPAAASGDWFGSMLVRPAENKSVSLTIDQQVP